MALRRDRGAGAWVNALQIMFRGGWIGAVIVGGLVTAVPFVNLLTLGYVGLVFRSCLRGGEQSERWLAWNQWELTFRSAIWVAGTLGIIVSVGAAAALVPSLLDPDGGLFPNPYVWVLVVIPGSVFYPLMLARAFRTGNALAGLGIGRLWRWFDAYFGVYLPQFAAALAVVMLAAVLYGRSAYGLVHDFSGVTLLWHYLASVFTFFVLVLVSRVMAATIRPHADGL